MSNVTVITEQLSPVETMSELVHSVTQLFPDGYIDIDNESDMVVIYTHVRYRSSDGTLLWKEV